MRQACGIPVMEYLVILESYQLAVSYFGGIFSLPPVSLRSAGGLSSPSFDLDTKNQFIGHNFLIYRRISMKTSAS